MHSALFVHTIRETENKEDKDNDENNRCNF